MSLRRHFASFVTSVVLAFVLVEPSGAVIIAEEQFDYSNGDLGGQNGGTGWTSAWAPVSPATNSTWVVNGGVAVTNGNDGDAGLYMRRGVTVPDAATTPYYFRFDHTIPTLADGEASIYGGLSLGQDGTQTGSDITVFFQHYPGGNQPYHLRMKLGPNGSISNNIAQPGNEGTLLSFGQTYTVVGRVEPNFTPTNTRVTLWLNPTAESNTPHLQGTTGAAPLASAFVPAPAFLGLYRESQNSTFASTDDIRIGTTFFDVTAVPEPASAALLAAAVTCLIAPRRQR